jgi:hypothetical protein
MAGQTDRQTDREIDGLMERWKDKWTDRGETDRWMNIQTDGRMDR